MSDLISRKYLLSKIKGKCTDADTQGYVDLEDIEDAPLADIMECARAIKKYCYKTECKDCSLYEVTCKNNCPPYMWGNLPEGGKE